VATIVTYSQSYFSVDKRTFTYWDSAKEDFVEYDSDSQKSLFKLNDNETLFEHTTEKMTSVYYITKSEFNKENYVWSYDVISDAGNRYTFVFDPKNNQIRSLMSIVDKDKNDQDIVILVMIVYHIKKAFTDPAKTRIQTPEISDASSVTEI
jgi:hypothetical protein